MTTFERLLLTGMRFLLWRMVDRNYGRMTDKERKWMADTHMELIKDDEDKEDPRNT